VTPCFEIPGTGRPDAVFPLHGGGAAAQ